MLAAVSPGGKWPAWGDLAGMEPGRPLCRSRCTRIQIRSRGRPGAAAEQFEARWKGRYAWKAAKASGDEGLGAVIEAYEQLEELMGRIISYAGLAYFTGTSDNGSAKFLRRCAKCDGPDTSAHLLFFALELNRIDDGRDRGDSLSRIAGPPNYTPWIHDLRLDRPYHSTTVSRVVFTKNPWTGHAAWIPAFRRDHGWIGIHNRRRKCCLSSTRWSMLQHSRGCSARRPALALAATFREKPMRTFTLITNTLAKDKGNFRPLARVRGHRLQSTSRPTGSSGRLVDALAQAVLRRPARVCRIATTR